MEKAGQKISSKSHFYWKDHGQGKSKLSLPKHQMLFRIQPKGRDDVTVSFVLSVFDSGLDGAGRGVFLTFVGDSNGNKTWTTPSEEHHGFVDIGLYCPVSAKDTVKSVAVFTAKNYVHKGRPEKYAFKIIDYPGCGVLDVTSDKDGSLRPECVETLLPFMNGSEEGHNVFSTAGDSVAGVRYKLMGGEEFELDKPKELFVSYGSGYNYENDGNESNDELWLEELKNPSADEVARIGKMLRSIPIDDQELRRRVKLVTEKLFNKQ